MTPTIRPIEAVQADLDAIHDVADEESRDLTAAELDTLEALESELTASQAHRARVDAARARRAELRAAATPALITNRTSDADADAVLARAFNAYLRTGRPNADLTQLTAAQSEGVPTEGGFLVPPGMRKKFVDRMKAFGGVGEVVEQVTTATGNTIQWPTVDDTANTGEIVSEGGTFSAQADLVFGSANLGAYPYMAGGGSSAPLRISLDLLQDSEYDIEGKVASKLGERIARIQAVHVVTGTGVSQPQGITAGLTPIQTAANNALTYDDLVHFVHAVDPAYRTERCRWAFNDLALEEIETIKDTNGRPIIKAGEGSAATSPNEGTILGYRFVVDQAFPNFTNNSPTIKWGVFGDLEEGYVRRRVRDIVVVVNPWTRAANRQVEYTAWARMDAVQQNTAAYIAMAGKS